MVRDFRRAPRLEHRDPLAPSGAAQRESLFDQHLASDEGSVALIDCNQMLIVERQMAQMARDALIRISPFLASLDHMKLSYQYSGREIRLTDLAGQVAMDIIT